MSETEDTASGVDPYRLPPDHPLLTGDGAKAVEPPSGDLYAYARFLSGPVDLDWLRVAYDIRDVSALWVAVNLWRLHRMAKGKPFPVSNTEAAQWGVDRFQKSRAIAKLEHAGLIEVDRDQGKAVVVRIVQRPTATPVRRASRGRRAR